MSCTNALCSKLLLHDNCLNQNHRTRRKRLSANWLHSSASARRPRWYNGICMSSWCRHLIMTMMMPLILALNISLAHFSGSLTLIWFLRLVHGRKIRPNDTACLTRRRQQLQSRPDKFLRLQRELSDRGIRRTSSASRHAHQRCWQVSRRIDRRSNMDLLYLCHSI